MRREQGGCRDVFARCLKRQARILNEQASALKGQERSVAFVHVVDRGSQIHRAQQTHATATEHDLLLDARLTIAAVEVARDVAVLLAVLRQGSIEQIQRHTANARAPGP